MNQPGNAGFAYDYALLRATPGCDLDELKRCYRLAVRGLHPDLNPEL
ncbi:MAG: J domain-containing protein, partial [Xanthomonadales bacterium]|nr:J domain-containing protein [Xanthomonadales bacterium]